MTIKKAKIVVTLELDGVEKTEEISIARGPGEEIGLSVDLEVMQEEHDPYTGVTRLRPGGKKWTLYVTKP